MSQQGQEDAEATGSGLDLPATPSSHSQHLESDDFSRPGTASSEEELPVNELERHLQAVQPDTISHSDQIASEDTSINENPQLQSSQSQQPKLHSSSHSGLGVDERMLIGWRVHDVQKFTPDYSGQKDDLDTLWTESFDGFDRPKPYEVEKTAPGSFLPIVDPEIYVDLLKDPNSHSTEELYAITANAAKALEVWQDEYLAIDELSRWSTRRVLKKTADPRKLEDPQVSEDKKEARLYGYKYDSRPSKVGNQNPFLQGGFKPTADQMKKMAAAATDAYNVDGWTPVIKDGVEYVPRIRPPPPPEPKRKPGAPIVETETGRNAKRVTRFGGSRNAVTRENSQALSDRSSPTPSVATRTQSPEASETPFTGISKRKTRSGAQRGSVTPSRSTATRSKVTKPSALGPNRIRTGPISAPTTGVTTTATTPTTPGPSAFYDDPLLDPKNQEKIRLSKHPKRTEAMIRHWAKFNSEGRTRNPKRTKAQIEADKAARVAAGTTWKRGPGRKRKPDLDDEIPTAASTPISKRRRRQPGKPKAISEAGSPASMMSVQALSAMGPTPVQESKTPDSSVSTSLHTAQ